MKQEIINPIRTALKRLPLAVPLAAAMWLGSGSSAHAQLPVTSGLVLRVDASQITGTANGAQLNTWADTSGLANNAVRQGGSSAGYPMYVTGALNGQPVVRFNSGNGNTGDYFQFTRITTIRTVFWVLKDTQTSDTHFLLGDNSSYQFHRGQSSNRLWDGQYAHDNIKNGTTKLMGTAINGTTTTLPSGSFQLVSLVTTGNVQANQICQDRIYNGSWQGDIAEILIYNRALTGAEELEVGSYLSAKYALTTAYPALVAPAAPTGVVATLVSSGTISVSWPAVPFATSYNVSYTATLGGAEVPVPGVLGLSYTVTGLTNGTSYDFKVSATNGAGTSAYSAIVAAIPAAASGKDILTFVFPGQQDTVISGTDISVTVPTGTDLTMLAPTYTVSPYATGSPVSGSTQNFTSPQTYSITAEDGLLPAKDYTVTVTEGPVPTLFTWASAVSGNWSDNAKWTNDLATVAKPNNDGKADYTLNFTPAGTYTTTQNLSNGFLLNQLNFGGTVTLAGTNSLALTSNGATPPAINQNSGNTVTISAPLNLTADTTLGGSGAGQVSFNSGAISGAGSLTKTNSGELLISNVNSYTGKTSVNAGILRIAGSVAFTKAGVNGPLGAPVGANATIDLHNGTTLQTHGTNPRINQETDRPLNLAGTGPGTVTIRVNDNDTRFTFGSVTASGTGAKTLALFMGNQGNGDRESMIFTDGISDSSDASPTSLNVSFRTGNSQHLSLVGTSTFTGPISMVNVNAAGTSTLTVGGLYTGPNAANGLATVNVRGTGSLGAGNYPGNISLGSKTVLNYRSSVAQTLAGVISGAGTVTVDGLSTVTLTGLNTYTGNTTVPTGNTLALSDTGGMTFALTNTSTNKITGAGTATLDGTFTINTAAVTNASGSWTLVDTTSKSFGATFAVAGFTEAEDVWSLVDDSKTWTFTEGTGVLTLTSTAVFSSFGIPGYAGVIDNNLRTIRLVVPKDTDLATLAPTFTVTSGTVNNQPNDGTTPPTPTFAAALNNTVTYTLSSELPDKDYAVTVVLATGIINFRVSAGTDVPEVDLEGPAGPPVPGTQTWNQVTALPALSASGLLDSVGAPTLVGFSASGLEGADDWGLNAALKIFTRSGRVFSTAEGNAGSFTISGLTAGTYYDLWIASAHINGSGIGTWSTSNTNSTGASVGMDNTGQSGNGSTWVAGVNYVRFQNVKVNVSGNITMTVMNAPLQDNRVGFNGFQLIPVAAPPASDYETWATAYLPADVSNPAADSDGDGLTNQQEYAFGLNPTLGSSVNPITVPLDKTTGMFTYTRHATPASAGLTYSVQTSTDLLAWPVDVAAIQTVISTVNGVETVSVTLSAAIPLTAPSLFVRVQAAPTAP